jgi:pimeloyl-ACP methyl ester carboxylesterase
MTTPSSPADPPRLTAQVAGGSFTYTSEGKGFPIVAVHGLPGSARDFRWLGAALPRSVRFVRLELPGFGATPLATAPGPRIDERGRFVAEALGALGIERCVLLGHSMGGGVALSAAVQAQERVAALGLIASIGLSPHVLLRRFVARQAFARAVDLPLVRTPARALLGALFSAAGFPSSTPAEEVAHTTRCVAAVEFETQRRNTSALKVPTLTAWARDDAFIEERIFLEHAATLPSGPRLSWETGGHNVQKSQAVELAEALVELAAATSRT